MVLHLTAIEMAWVKQLVEQKPGGDTRIIVLYTCATRETQNRVVFLGSTRFIPIAIRGQNVPIFQKKRPFWILLRGV